MVGAVKPGVQSTSVEPPKTIASNILLQLASPDKSR